MNIPAEIRDRFVEKFIGEPNSGCWLWTASVNRLGYGVFQFDGHLWKAHRFSYALHIGPIPDGLFVLHKCDTPACVRPDHLFLGTHAENMKDMSQKKRGKGPVRLGMSNHRAKLTDAQVIEIRQSSATLQELSDSFGVSKQFIGQIRKGKRRSLVS